MRAILLAFEFLIKSLAARKKNEWKWAKIAKTFKNRKLHSIRTLGKTYEVTSGFLILIEHLISGT